MIRVGFYAGSFDPITRGHLDVIEQALTIFDRVIVAVGRNAAKTGLFKPHERGTLIIEACSEMFSPEVCERIEPRLYDGSLAQEARSLGATHLVRAFRQASDFNDEFGIHGVMEKIAPDLPMVYLIGKTEHLHVSSSMARELARIGEDMSWIVPESVERALKAKIAE